MKTKIVGVVLGFLLGLSAAVAHAEDSDLQKIVKRGVIRIGAPITDPWYIKEPGSQKWTGFVPELVELIFGAIKVKIEYVDTTWDTAAAGLQAGRFDAIGVWNATPQRALVFDFTDPILSINTGLLVMAGDSKKFSTWQGVDESGSSIVAVEGTSIANMNTPKYKNVKWVFAQSYEAALLEILSGRADAMLATQVAEEKIVKTHKKGKVVVPTPIQGAPASIGMRKSNPPELREFINQSLRWYRANGEYEKIANKYQPPN